VNNCETDIRVGRVGGRIIQGLSRNGARWRDHPWQMWFKRAILKECQSCETGAVGTCDVADINGDRWVLAAGPLYRPRLAQLD
jgi:hypothetical protein